MARDPYTQREDERAWDDELDRRRLEWERADRAAEKGSVSPQEAHTALAALEPASSPVPPLSYQGRIPAPQVVQVGPWHKLLRVLGWTGAFILAWILALALAVTIFEGVAWVMSGP